MSRYLGLGAALGALFALAGVATAGDDTMRLDLKKSSKITLTAGADGASQFTHDARAKASEENVEDVFFGYRRGYNRGYYGGGFYGPRFFPYRAGYWNGFYSRSYYYPSYYYPSVRYYYAPVYYPPVQTYYYASPVVAYVDPVGGSGATVAPTNTLQLPPPTRMPQPSERLPNPPRSNPMPPAYPYDGPSDALRSVPAYRYDGGPNSPIPMPPADVNPSGPTPKFDSAEGRVVKLTTAKKPAYQAYGDNRRKTESGADRTVTVKKTND